MSLKKKLKKWWNKLVDKVKAWVDEQNRLADEAETEAGEPGSGFEPPVQTAVVPLGLASCWGGSNASQRMMNVLSPKMTDATFKNRLKFMTSRGCTVAHVFVANQGDGECAGYAGWNDSDKAKMLERMTALRAAGLTPVPWVMADDSNKLAEDLFANADARVKALSDAGFFKGAPYVVLGLEMDEYGSAAKWTKVKNAVAKYYKGPLGVHHASGDSFKYAGLASIVLGQLDPKKASESAVKAQIKKILALKKRAVGFEYSRGPAGKLARAALEAGAEGVGNWDGGAVPGVSSATSSGEALSVVSPSSDGVDFSSLKWCWGAFNGSKAQAVDGVRIKDLKVSSDKLTYAWESGGCEKLGAKNREDAACIAALFCLIDGNWVGGKFEWISTSRASRDLENVHEGYAGWDRLAPGKAKAFAFVIVSKDGKKRTNVAVQGV